MKIYETVIRLDDGGRFDSYVVKFEQSDDYNMIDEELAKRGMTDDDIYYYFAKDEEVENGMEINGGEALIEVKEEIAQL